jgi:hypothetical protein
VREAGVLGYADLFEGRIYGLNEAKRTRLIKAGADVIIADFSQSGRLLEVLNLL